MSKTYEARVTDFTPDPNNANAGTERGTGMILRSVQDLGPGRSLVADKNNILAAGNKTQEALVSADLDRAIVVETDGKTAVIVKRTDWDLLDDDPDNPARRYAYADNRTSQVSFNLDPVVVVQDIENGLYLGDYFTPAELETIELAAEQGETMRDYFSGMDDDGGASSDGGEDSKTVLFVEVPARHITAVYEFLDSLHGVKYTSQ